VLKNTSIRRELAKIARHLRVADELVSRLSTEKGKQALRRPRCKVEGCGGPPSNRNSGFCVACAAELRRQGAL
jgi:hypothetical protein